MVCLERQDLQTLFEALLDAGYTLLGPQVRDAAVVYDELRGVEQLPVGWGDRQEAGYYRLYDRGDGALFGYNLGPHSWKQFLFPSRSQLWSASKTADGFIIASDTPPVPAYAFIGVRACELQALQVQDAVFADNNPDYGQRREASFVVAVHCGQAAATCFCTSMGTGPRAGAGFDVALTEVVAADRHYFLVETGSELGAAIVGQLPTRPATEHERDSAAAAVAHAEAQMVRRLDNARIKEAVQTNLEHPYWRNVADSCLSCANCTLVCPTCFCSRTEDTTDLTGDHAERWLRWDSCFSGDFSSVHGGAVRTSVASRYRQWASHKLANWWDQFGQSGCVGCGRCVAWCPVGIDITEVGRVLLAPQGCTK